MTRRSSRPRDGGAADPQLDADAGTGGRWRLRNWRLRTKLLAVLLIPTLTLVTLVGLRIGADLDRAEQFAEAATRVRVDDRLAEVVHQLQRERDLTVRYVAAGRQGDLAGLRDQRGRVDTAIGEFDREFADAQPRLSGSASAAFQRSEDRLGLLTGLRYAGEHSTYPAGAVLRSYSGLVSGLLDIGDEAASEPTDRDLTRMRLAVNALARVKDQMSVKRALVAAALATGELPADQQRALLGAEAELAAARSDYNKFATAEQQRMYDDTVIGLVVDIGNGMVESVLNRAEDGEPLDGLDAGQWDVAATYTVNLVDQVQDAVLVQLRQRTDALAGQAREAASWDAAIVLGVLLVGGALAAIVARSLLRPLRTLRRTALDVAQHRLPAAVEEILADPDPRPEGVRQLRGVAPVPVYSREELGEVARAFDVVHGQAVRLAGEQALLRENVNSMFVNLSRRSQQLVERQLSVLDRMEADEQDPDTLGGLFELDHLATRMRRNSENLLVLSGQDLEQGVDGAISAEEIIGAALSEVEHYQRIDVVATPELAVRGDAVSDLVHVISELLENATEYSGAEPVTLVSSATVAGDWRIEITDRGAGMPPAEVARVNARLAQPPDVDVEVSRRMGLYVVARLARRHQIGVRLGAAIEGGITATIIVPAVLVTDVPEAQESPRELPAAPPPEPEPVAEPVVDHVGHLEQGEPELPGPLYVPLRLLQPQLETSETAEPASQPQVAERPSLDRSLAEHGPPRRAPVEDWDAPPAWPSEDDDPDGEFDFDGPTERMPAYQKVLSEWFGTGTHKRDSEPDTVELERVEPVWPGPEENGDEPSVLPKRMPRVDLVPSVVDTPLMDDGPIVSRAPDAVRLRMASLQSGVRRGRHERPAPWSELGTVSDAALEGNWE
ncbi:sensor histidine kinase [Amycolatopsis palatopharyngis]|uniref:sensor histidine kinase n=1 Tax=Amycolatopsis palatopharyngis TaxID=187982 RepID=UPI000E264916|nr:nitrate- and nitrite sensing domain-containing protein [Amycolatopsis palatopharyngis]